MPHSTADQYRAWADECRTLADNSERAEDRLRWLRIAHSWETLANSAWLWDSHQQSTGPSLASDNQTRQ